MSPDKIFSDLGEKPAGEVSNTISTLFNNCKELVSRSTDCHIRDVALVTVLQYMKHYEIAGYGSTCSYANELGMISIADQLHKSLDEEKQTDELLTKMAFGKIYEDAISSVNSK